MNQSDALLRTILEHPDDDLPRLCFADFLEENGDAARAEFLRVQVELARTECSSLCNLQAAGVRSNGCVCKRNELRRRERELLAGPAPWDIGHVPLYFTDASSFGYRCGFISWLTCSWQDWLTHHEKLYWHPKQTEECPKCIRGMCNDMDIGDITFAEWPCENCGGIVKDERGRPANVPGSGRIPRPFVNTAMPLELVRLTTWPGGTPQPTYTGSFQIDAETRFDRVKCGTCDGTGFDPASTRLRNPTPLVHRCPDCHGTPLNSWTCSAWPGVTFKMPEANTMAEFSREALRDIARGMTAPLDALGRAMHGIAESVVPALGSVADAWPRDADGNMIQFDGDGDVEG